MVIKLKLIASIFSNHIFIKLKLKIHYTNNFSFFDFSNVIVSRMFTKEMLNYEIFDNVSISNLEIYFNQTEYKYYQNLRSMCGEGRIGCFYYVALLESEKSLLESGTCPENYKEISGDHPYYGHKIEAFENLTLCRKNSINPKEFSKSRLEKLKKEINFEIKDIDLNNLDYYDREQLIYDFPELENINPEDIDQIYKIKIFQWGPDLHVNCTDYACEDYSKELFFYNVINKKNYSLRENNIYMFLKGKETFLIQKKFIDLGHIEHNFYHNKTSFIDPNYYVLKRNEIIIIKNFLNKNLDSNNISVTSLDGKVFFLYQFGGDFEPQLNNLSKNKFKINYTMKNPYRGNLFVLIEKKNKTIKYEGKNSYELSDINLYIGEVSDSFKILNLEKIYSEENVKFYKPYRYYG